MATNKDKTTPTEEKTPFEAPAAESTAMVAVTMDDDNGFVADMTKRVQAYCSFAPTTQADRVKLFNMINSPDKRLKGAINMPIPVVHIYAEMVRCVKEETGEVEDAPRVVFLSADGTAYQCVSTGIFSAVKKLFGIFGTPDRWEQPVTIIPKLIEKGKNNILTFDIA